MPWMPWALYALSLICFAVVFRTQALSVGLPALLVALVAMVWATLLLAQARIESRSQSLGSLLGPEELALMRAQAEARRKSSEAERESAPNA